MNYIETIEQIKIRLEKNDKSSVYYNLTVKEA